MKPGRTSSPARDRALGLCLALAIVAVIFIYYRLARLIPFYDALHLFLPQFSLLADFGRAGQFLLWNPYQNGGSPDLAYPEFGNLSPFTLGLAALTGGGDQGFILYWLTIWAVFGFGSCVLALHLGAPRRAAMALAVALMFFGLFIGGGANISSLYGFSFLPLILWRLDAGLLERRWRPAAEAGALYGLSALASHPQMVTLSGIYLGLWAAGRALFPDEAGETLGRRSARAAVSLALMLSVALLILSPVYLSFFHETPGYSERAGYLPRAHAISYGELPASALATLASPYLATLTVFNPDLWPGAFRTLASCHAGSIIPALAVTLLILRPRRRFAWWLLGVGIFFLAAALGDATPVRGWLYDYLPPTRFFRHASIFRVYFLFSLGAMAMLAAAEIFPPSAPARSWKKLLSVSAVLLPLMTAVFAWTLTSVANRGPWLVAAIVEFAISWAGLTAVAAYGFRAAKRGNVDAAALLLLGLALLDAGFSLYLSRPLMADNRDRYQSLWAQRSRSIELYPWGFAREPGSAGPQVNNFHLLTKRPALVGYNMMSNRFHSGASLTGLAANWSSEPTLAAAALGADRIWFSPTAPRVFPSDATFLALVERARQLGAIPLVIHRPEDVMRTPPRGAPGPDDAADAAVISRLPAARRIGYRLLAYTPTRLALSVDCEEAGWLLVTDRWSRSWTVKVNGQPAPLFVGDFLWRAVKVGAGPQTVEFEFHPWLFPLLLYVSWGTMAMVVGVSLYRWRRRRG